MSKTINPDEDLEWAAFSHDDIEENLAIVKHALLDRESVEKAATELIAYFYYRIEHGQKYDHKQLESLIHHAFGKVVNEGWRVGQGFGLEATRGHYQRKHIQADRNIELAAAMHLLNKHLGYSWDDARHKVGAMFHVGEKAVENAYQECREAIELCSQETLREMLPSGLGSLALVKHEARKRPKA